MDLDDEVCLCFHVSKRKIVNFLRIEQPRRPGQISECFGAGTGCGWCRTYLKWLFHEVIEGGGVDPHNPDPHNSDPHDPAPADYARGRASYVRSGGGVPPPGATPIESTAEPP